MNDDKFLSAIGSKQLVQTPGGLIVAPAAIDSLVKAQVQAETVKIVAEEQAKRGALFSMYAQNMALYGAREKPQGTPGFAVLRAAAKHSFVDAIVIRARVDQVKRIWQRTFSEDKIGFRVVHERHDDPSFKGSKEIDSRCREMEALLMDPTPEKHLELYPHRIRPHTRTNDLVSVLTKAELVIDRKVIRRLRRADKQGYAAFYWLPGDTIKNTDEAMRDWAKKNENKGVMDKWTAERMSYATGFDIAKCSHVQIVDAQLVAAFYPEEISIHISNPSDELNRFGYGESRLELSLDITSTLMYAWNYNKEMFKTNYPENILAVIGSYDKEGLQAFKQQILGETGAGGNWRLPVIPFTDKESADIKSIKLRESPKDMLFDQFIRLLIMVKLAAYGAHAATLNLSTDSGGGQSLFGGKDAIEEIEFSKEQGLVPSITDMCEWLTDAIVKPRYEDLKVIVVGLEKKDEKGVVELRTSRVSKWMTRNEARMEEGKPPLGFYLEPEKYNALEDGDPDKAKYETNVYNWPADAPAPNYINTFSMAQQQQGGDNGDDDGQDWGDQEADQYYQGDQGENTPLKKSKRDTKFLEIKIEDD
jgi:hypothetical protein